MDGRQAASPTLSPSFSRFDPHRSYLLRSGTERAGGGKEASYFQQVASGPEEGGRRREAGGGRRVVLFFLGGLEINLYNVGNAVAVGAAAIFLIKFFSVLHC